MNYDDLPRTRSEAIRLGVKYYYTAKMCKHRHYDKRRVHGGCNTCFKLVWNRNQKARAKKQKEFRAEALAQCSPETQKLIK